MSGQIQIKKYNQDTLLNYHTDFLSNQADLYFMEKKFALDTKYDKFRMLHSLLLKDVLCTDNCEIINFLNKKLRGALGDENIDIVDLKTMQTKYRDINNYYYTQPFEWTEVKW